MPETATTVDPSDPLASSRVLVTGGTGFVGRHVVRKLAERGATVRALVRPSSDRRPIAEHVDEWFEGDLTSPASIRGACAGIDAVIHTACAVASTFDAGREAESKFMAVNRDGTVAIAEEAASAGVRLVHVSSTAAMGTPEASVVDESSPCQPSTPYQRSKHAAERALLKLHAERDLDVVIVRPCLVAGAGKDWSELLKLFKMARRAFVPYIGHDLDVQKPLIHVDDLVQALILALHRGQSGGIYLVHSGARHTMRDILGAVAELTGKDRVHRSLPVPVARAIATVFEGVQRVAPDWNPPLTHRRIDLFLKDRRIDISRARDELGYEPQHQSVLEMLGETYAYYREQGLL